MKRKLRRRSVLSLVGTGVLAGCSRTSDDTTDAEGPTSNADDPGVDESPAETDRWCPNSQSVFEDRTAEIERSFSGSGSEVIEGIELAGGLAIVELQSQSSEEPRVSFFTQNGNEAMEKVPDRFDGERAGYVDGGPHSVEISADSGWELVIRQPIPEPANPAEPPISISHHRSVVEGPYLLGRHNTVAISNETEGPLQFTLYRLDSKGIFYAGTDLTPGAEESFFFCGSGYLEVVCDSQWSLTVT